VLAEALAGSSRTAEESPAAGEEAS